MSLLRWIVRWMRWEEAEEHVACGTATCCGKCHDWS